MVMLMRTLLFPVDNGMGTGLSGDGYAAEYDLWTGKVTWRRIGDDTIAFHKKLVSVLSIIAAILSPFVVTGLVLFIKHIDFWDSGRILQIYRNGPIICGIIFFLAFELLMLAIRSRYPIATIIPTRERQYNYFKTMYDITIRKNDVMPDNSIPYVGSYIAFLIAFLPIPMFYNAYLDPNSSYSQLGMLIATSVLISLIPNMLWNMLLKQLIYIKLIRKTKGSEADSSHKV